MLRCDSQDLTLQAILSNGVATVRQTLRRMFSAMAAERAKERRKLLLRPGYEQLTSMRLQRMPSLLAGCGKTRFEASAVPQNSLVSTTQPDKKKVCVDKTSSSWMCSAT